MIPRLLKRCPRYVPCSPSNTLATSRRTIATSEAAGLSNIIDKNFVDTKRYKAPVSLFSGPQPTIVDGVLTVTYRERPFAVSGRWLRDNCACSVCRNTETKQRQINVFKNPEAGKVVNAVEQAGEHKTYKVTFADGHCSTIPRDLIQNRRTRETSRLREGIVDPKYWEQGISTAPPTVEYEAVQEPTGMGSLLHHIREYGFCFVDNMPATPDATRTLLEQIGPIRNTHYGGFYDFTSDLSSKDTAYTSESLEPHTDTTYFTDPIGLQALHLLSHTDGEGGLSSLVDGFAAAQFLQQTNPDAYHALTRTKVYAHASGNEGVSIQPVQGYPVFYHSARDGDLTQVRWNTADRAGIVADISPMIDRWYDAAAEFDEILSEPENQYWFQLKPGKMLLFDNWRVLHGRSAFTGKRRMCGGYINRDDFISKYRTLNLTKEEHDASTITG